MTSYTHQAGLALVLVASAPGPTAEAPRWPAWRASVATLPAPTAMVEADG